MQCNEKNGAQVCKTALARMSHKKSSHQSGSHVISRFNIPAWIDEGLDLFDNLIFSGRPRLIDLFLRDAWNQKRNLIIFHFCRF